MAEHIVYDDTCELHCTDNDKTLPAEVLDFRAGAFLKVSIQRQFAITLSYVPQHNIYVGSLGGKEFTTAGPKGRDVSGRTRHF